MVEEFILSNELIDSLDDQDLYLLVESIPNEILLNHIKRHHKRYKDDIRGIRLDLRSSLLINKLPWIFVNRLNRKEAVTVKFIEHKIKFCLKMVDKHILEATSDKDYFNKAISADDKKVFDGLLNLVSDILHPKYFKLYFSLWGYSLEQNQAQYIDLYIKTMEIKKQLEKEIQKEYEEEYKQKAAEYIKREDELKGKLNELYTALNEEKTKVDSLQKHNKKMSREYRQKVDELNERIKELQRNILSLEEEKLILKAGIEEKDANIQDLENVLEDKAEQYQKTVQKEWETKNKELLQITNKLSEECEQLKETNSQLVSNIQFLKSEEKDLTNKISEYKSIVDNFIENIDKKLIEKALFDSLIVNKQGTINSFQNVKETNLYVKNGKTLDSIEKCTDIYNFADNIAINLENVGIKKRADEIANYVVGVLATGLTPLICGFRARDIAYAISTSYSGEIPYIISLPSGYSDSKQLIDIYNNADSNVILIEDAVGTMNENALMPLFRERWDNNFSSKLLLLSTENTDSIRYMPLSMYEHVCLIMVNKYGLEKASLNPSNAVDVFRDFVLQGNIDTEYQSAQKTLRKLLNGIQVANPYKILRAAVLAYSSKLSNPSYAIEEYLRSELLFLCKASDNLIKLEENIMMYKLGDNLIKTVSGGLDE